jgi:hypothetical protein
VVVRKHKAEEPLKVGPRVLQVFRLQQIAVCCSMMKGQSDT